MYDTATGPSSPTCRGQDDAIRSLPGTRMGSGWPLPVPIRASRSGTWPRGANGDPGGSRAECHRPDVSSGRRPPGLARLGWPVAAVAPILRAATDALDLRQRRPVQHATAGGWDSTWNGERADLLEVTPVPRIPHPGLQRRYRRDQFLVRRLQPRRSPAGRGHERRYPPVGPAQRTGARRAARRDQLCLLRGQRRCESEARPHPTARLGGS